MHIPNGFLSDPVCAASTLASAAALGYGFMRARETAGFLASGTANSERPAALMAATGAGIFAAQMVNFPVDGGTSGHVIGAALAAIALGPWRGMLTMAVVVAIQCLVFGDGGLSVLGANLWNMAIVGTLVSAVLYQFTTRRVAGTPGRLLGAATAAFGSVLAAAAFCSVELAVSGTYALADVFPAMMSVHLLIASCEAIITTAVVAAAISLAAERRLTSPRSMMVAGLAIAIAVAGLLAPLASSHPDGLERVAENLNFASLATDSFALVPEYEAPGVTWPAAAVAIAGILGVLLVFASSYAVGRTAAVRVPKR
jgi:cobalt/nickel transport system permease protein